MIDGRYTRRSFLKTGLAGSALLFAADNSARGKADNFVVEAVSSGNLYAFRLKNVPPLFCVAYITPDAPGQENQQAIVARYPLALVPQDNRPVFRIWRDRVKELNPDILMLGYQIVIEESTVPGPGHDVMRTIKNSWCNYPGGFIPTVGKKGKQRRIYDPRSNVWQERFLEACDRTLASYPFDGIFLDQLTVYFKSHPSPFARKEMLEALRDAVLKLRREFPNVILIGNSSYSFTGLNGEMVENRIGDAQTELAPFHGHAQPRMELVHTILKNPADVENLVRDMPIAHARQAYYGASVDYQHVLWFEQFEAVVENYKRHYQFGN